MDTPQLTLYHFPGACSQVSLFALEEAELKYTLELVNLQTAEQASPAFLAVSPLGKVPSLLVDGTPLFENAAILTYIAAQRPEAGLFPPDPSPRMRAEIVGGLAFCSGTLHPQVRGIANPARLTTGDVAGVREMATKLAGKSFGYADDRLAGRGWWLGEWSVIDVYLNWAFATACRGGFDGTAFPELSRLAERLRARPAFARMIEGEAAGRRALGI